MLVPGFEPGSKVSKMVQRGWFMMGEIDYTTPERQAFHRLVTRIYSERGKVAIFTFTQIGARDLNPGRKGLQSLHYFRTTFSSLHPKVKVKNHFSCFYFPVYIFLDILGLDTSVHEQQTAILGPSTEWRSQKHEHTNQYTHCIFRWKVGLATSQG